MAYATDESASEESTASPVTRERRSFSACAVEMGLPTSSRLSPVRG